MNKQLLVVDDEPNIIELIRMNLSKSGFTIVPAFSGQEALEKIASQDFDMVLLDIMLPDFDGIEVLRQLRTNIHTADLPVIMLTARSEEADKVIGLGMGADDYMTKPFGLRELEARIRNVLRRKAVYQSAETKNVSFFVIDDLLIDTKRHLVSKNQEPIDLTPSEYHILLTMADEPHKVFTREELLEAIPGDKKQQDLRIVDVHIRNLRKKLSENDSDAGYIETIRGLGYRIKQVPV
jgi:DNA-binding response OmpR family regulator